MSDNTLTRRYVPHIHEDFLGTPRRYGEVAICGCGKVVQVAASDGNAWWRTVLWPWSSLWRSRLEVKR